MFACRGVHLDGRAAAQAAVAAARQAGGRISAFYCESILSCGGQVVLPAGYLQDVYQVMHEEGALCIADEVRAMLLPLAALQSQPCAPCNLLCSSTTLLKIGPDADADDTSISSLLHVPVIPLQGLASQC